jgi:hypothetical protein
MDLLGFVGRHDTPSGRPDARIRPAGAVWDRAISHPRKTRGPKQRIALRCKDRAYNKKPDLPESFRCEARGHLRHAPVVVFLPEFLCRLFVQDDGDVWM